MVGEPGGRQECLPHQSGCSRALPVSGVCRRVVRHRVRASRYRFLPSERFQSLGTIKGYQRGDHLIELPGQDRPEIEGSVYPVIHHDALLEPIGSDAQRALPAADHRGPLLGPLGITQPLVMVPDTSPQKLPGPLLVLVLALRFLHPYLNPGGDMNHVHGRGDLVDVLASGPLGGGDVNLNLRLGYLNLNFERFRQHRHRRRGGVDAPLRFSHRNPFDAVDASLISQRLPYPLPLDVGHDIPQTALLAAGSIERRELETLRRGVALVHLEKIRRPQAGFIAARRSADFQHDRTHSLIVGGDQIPGNGVEQGLGLPLQLRQLFPGQLDEFLVLILFENLAGFDKLAVVILVLAVPTDDSGEGGPLFSQMPNANVVGRHGRIGELAFDLFELVTK
jgi:hypothetical protein